MDKILIKHIELSNKPIIEKKAQYVIFFLRFIEEIK